MLNKILVYLKNFDWILFAAVLLLIFFGLAEIYSIALSNEDLQLLNFRKQAIFVVIGIILLFLLAFFDYHNFRSFSNYFYLLGLLLLVGVLFLGKTVRGTTGWFEFFGFSLQPVEFVKFFLIIFLARYFSGVSIRTNQLKHLIISGLGMLLFVGLVLKQPDFGSAFLLFLLWVIMVILAGFNKKYLIYIGLILVIALSFGWFVFFKDYQKQRIITFINPGSNTLVEGYNSAQATIAVGAGGLIGRGIGFGSQSQLKFLPESQNDFIFAVVAEELGFLGVCLIIFFFAVFFYRMLKSVKAVNNDFGIFFLLGATSLIFIEMFINIGMNVGLMPVVGISLPFLSYGGSAIISSLLIVGVVESIIIRSKLKY
ncbi:rod shape-determining protein RodA [bacterium]|nr:rod shape-determining protein RodA [bacterium]